MKAFGQLDHLVSVQARAQCLQVIEVHLKAVLDVIRYAALLAGRRLHQRVRGDSADKMRPQIGGKFGIALIAKRLDAAHDRGFVYVITLGESARRQEVIVLGIIHDGRKQLGAAGI